MTRTLTYRASAGALAALDGVALVAVPTQAGYTPSATDTVTELDAATAWTGTHDWTGITGEWDQATLTLRITGNTAITFDLSGESAAAEGVAFVTAAGVLVSHIGFAAPASGSFPVTLAGDAIATIDDGTAVRALIADHEVRIAAMENSGGGPDPSGAAAGHVWTADGAGAADWLPVPSGGGGSAGVSAPPIDLSASSGDQTVDLSTLAADAVSVLIIIPDDCDTLTLDLPAATSGRRLTVMTVRMDPGVYSVETTETMLPTVSDAARNMQSFPLHVVDIGSSFGFTGLTWAKAVVQPPDPHTHDSHDIDTTGHPAGLVLTADGGGGADWLPAGGSSTVTSTDITDSTTVGRSVLTATDAAAARTTLDAASASHTHTPSSVGAAPEVHSHTAAQVSGLSEVATSGSWNDLGDVPTFADLAADGDWTDIPNLEDELYPPIDSSLTSGNLESGKYTRITLTGALTINGMTSLERDLFFTTLEITNAGAHPITWPSSWQWEGGAPPTMTGRTLIVIVSVWGTDPLAAVAVTDAS